MPDFMSTLMDRAPRREPRSASAELSTDDQVEAVLPASGWRAMVRGARGCCPRCGQSRLFRRFLKPIDQCGRCGQDWSLQRADDFPAYVSIFVTGHLMAPIIIALINADWLSTAALGAVVVTLSLALLLATLQPAKGAIIALQWWFGMHGFKRS